MNRWLEGFVSGFAMPVIQGNLAAAKRAGRPGACATIPQTGGNRQQRPCPDQVSRVASITRLYPSKAFRPAFVSLYIVLGFRSTNSFLSST